MDTREYREVLYTIEVDWKGERVWLNNHVSKEKLVLTEKDSEYIYDCFQDLKAKRMGLY
ncbi:hypothetical protein [Peptoclostridium sp.]|uniref:hypothetical protein n=1 Tax=Peptoclostridium sp. TaxID=1904860 RepID=UPI0025EB16DA|nr:hypothetical protein [Peptoclostridium sp.]